MHGAGWNKRTLRNAPLRYEPEDNIGILLGSASGDLTRLDADFEGVPGVTDLLFRELTLTFGRATSQHSGRLVKCKTKNQNFVLPNAMADHPRLPLHNGEKSLMVFQVMSSKTQAMVPPSIHPGTGEEIVWQSESAPLEIEAPELIRRVGLEAFLMAVTQFWPARGTRNEAAMALARVLLEALGAKHPDDEERIELVDALIVEVAMAGGDGEASRVGKERARNTL
jgi:hypothetical protein